MVVIFPELCMAWMDSISEDLVGCIKNDLPQQIENGVITVLDSNGQKQVVLQRDGEYRVVYKATANGTMTISTPKYIRAETGGDNRKEFLP